MKGVDHEYAEGLGRMMSGVYAHISENVLSAPLACHMMLNDGRFQFSHGGAKILLTQMEDFLDGKEVNVKLRKRRGGGAWPDCFD